jgi:putative transposase
MNLSAFFIFKFVINKQQNRTGSLFQKPFRRKHIAIGSDLKKVATYIHHNVIHHNYASYFDAYPLSSYNSIISEQDTRLARNELLFILVIDTRSTSGSKSYFI